MIPCQGFPGTPPQHYNVASDDLAGLSPFMFGPGPLCTWLAFRSWSAVFIKCSVLDWVPLYTRVYISSSFSLRVLPLILIPALALALGSLPRLTLAPETFS